MPFSYYRTVDDYFLIDAIHRAEREVWLTAPGISMAVAAVLLETAVRLDGKVHLLVDASPGSFRLGYCDPEVIRFLQRKCLQQGLHTFRSEQGIRIGVLTTDEKTIFFTPNVLTMEKINILSINGVSSPPEKDIFGTPIGLTELTDIVIQDADVMPIAIPQTKEEQLQVAIREKDAQIDALKKQVKDLERAKGMLPIQQNLQFIDIEISQYRLDKLRIKIPSEFLTDTRAVNDRLNSKYLVIESEDLMNVHLNLAIHDKRFPYTLRCFLEEIDELRNYTISLGKWKRAILVKNRDAFDAKCNCLRDIAQKIQNVLPKCLQQKIHERLEELYRTLRPQILRRYKNEIWWNTYELEKVMKQFFFDKMQPEIDNFLNFFDPQIKVIYRDISLKDAENPDFRKEVENAFEKATADQLFADVMK